MCLGCTDELSPVGPAAILAETGDLTRFTSAPGVVKRVGLAPRERKSGTFTRQSPPVRRRPTTATRRRMASRVGLPASQPRMRRGGGATHPHRRRYSTVADSWRRT